MWREELKKTNKKKTWNKKRRADNQLQCGNRPEKNQEILKYRDIKTPLQKHAAKQQFPSR